MGGGRFKPADHAKGDASTIGGYMAVHDRPAAFEGRDGLSYSVGIEAAETGDPAAPWGGYLLFLRWRRVGEQGVEGHVETDFLARGASEADVIAAVGRMSLRDVQRALDALLHEEAGAERRWWDAMRDEDDDRGED